MKLLLAALTILPATARLEGFRVSGPRMLQTENEFGLDQTGIVPVGNTGGVGAFDRTASLFEGDIMLTREQAFLYGDDFVEQLEGEGFKFLDLSLGPGVERSLANQVGSLWPDRNAEGRLEVAYQFDTATFPNADTTRRSAARNAMDRLEDSGVVRFVEQTTETNFFEFANLNASTCYYNGGVGPQSTINLGWCNSNTQLVDIMHEIDHTLGFWHEHSRPDRGSFITVTSTVNNSNWAIRPASQTDSLGSAYDYASFMHYPSGAFGGNLTFTLNNPLPTCLSNAGLGVGQKRSPSWEDIDQLRLRYHCATGTRTGPVPLADYCTTDCRCWENALGDCDSDAECQDDLICGEARDPGPEDWMCEPTTRILPDNMCRTNTAPVANCQDITRTADASGVYEISLSDVDAGSFDPDGHIIDPTVELIVPGSTTLPLGTTTVTVRITDTSGLTGECEAVVTVVGDTAPTCPIVIRHHHDNLCFYFDYMLELRTCPSNTEISNDQYDQGFKWHFNNGLLYNYGPSRCLGPAISPHFQKVVCNPTDVSQLFGFIPVRHRRHSILHFQSGLCMEMGGRIAPGRFQVGAVECSAEREQRFNITNFDPDCNLFYLF